MDRSRSVAFLTAFVPGGAPVSHNGPSVRLLAARKACIESAHPIESILFAYYLESQTPVELHRTEIVFIDFKSDLGELESCRSCRNPSHDPLSNATAAEG